jgi:L,D-peptidoglycan transpeptidase YkuD (ErfK/YbiS/YcfS/YnhG family)
VSGDGPGEPPFAAAIFLHRHAFTAGGAVKPTSGCVSLAIEDLVPTLTLIDPAHHPYFVIGPTDWLRSTA